MPDLPTQLRGVFDELTPPVELSEIVGRPRRPPSPGPVRNRRLWWVAAAAVVVLVVGAAVLASRSRSDDSTVATPQGTVDADSYPDPGSVCGGSRVLDGVQLRGPLSADACIGVAAAETDPTTVYVTSPDGGRIFGGWTLSTCQAASDSTAQLEIGDDNSPVLMMGVVPSDATAVQFRMRDGEVITARTGALDGVVDRRFYAIQMPANPRIASKALLGTDGDPVQPPDASCPGAQPRLPDDAIEDLARSLIAESSATLGGIQVGDPCLLDARATPPMAMLIDGDINTSECIVVGWTPHSDIPGVPMGYYGQDGTILWGSADEERKDPPADLREQALEWAARH